MLGRLMASCALLLPVAVSAQSDSVTSLRQEDFEQGTYRIRTPGTYRLEEDVDFSPHAANNFWVPENLREEYPHSQYYLGFFAAITVEVSGVVIDLGGHTLRQGKEFYLMQRFFNVIELNDRVFIENEGVSSLNYQKGDKVTETAARTPALVAVSNVVIKNGVLGRSSHAGLHGNGAQDVTVQDVEIRDFEVAGFQCNGCKGVVVEDCVVGPSATEVPTLATFSSARFLDLYVNTLIPYGFNKDAKSEQLLPALDEAITFADRDEPTTVKSVFTRLGKAVELFRAHHMNETAEPLSDEDEALLQEAIHVFHNPTGLTDGGVLYGLFFNKLGVADPDDNHYQAGVETEDIVVSRTEVHGLKAHPLEVPALVTQSGHRIQGPARDVLRIFEVVSGTMRSLIDTKYSGNFLSDTYFAMWQLSNKFYNTRVFESECGNYGSNATMPYNLAGYPSAGKPTCAAAGQSQDTSLTGRDVTMLQKRYFGGLTVSQGLFEWATQKDRTLETLLLSSPSADIRRQTRHSIRCDGDTMFHVSHGVVAVKIVQAKEVTLSRVAVSDIVNTADLHHWVCEQTWEMANGEAIMPVKSIGSGDSASVRGIEVVRSELVELSRVDVRDLDSHEGRTYGIEVVGDANDRTEHDDDEGIAITRSSVQSLRSGGGPAAGTFAFSGSATAVQTGGLTVGKPTELGAALGNPKTIIHMEIDLSGPLTDDAGAPSIFDVVTAEVLEEFMQLSSFDTIEKVKGLRAKVVAHLKVYFGIKFADDVDDVDLLSPLVMLDQEGNPTDSVVVLIRTPPSTGFHIRTACTTDALTQEQTCVDNLKNTRNREIFWRVVFGSSGYTVYGTFGGDQGQFTPEGAFIDAGEYVLNGLDIPGVTEGRMVEVLFMGLCPMRIESFGNDQVLPLNCAIESSLFGKGFATGTYTSIQRNGTWRTEVYNTMHFDDFEVSPTLSPVAQKVKEGHYFNHTSWQFRVIADGTYGLGAAASDLSPLTGHHFTHEAGVYFLKRKTSVDDDAKVLALRTEFLTLLKDYYQIQQVQCATCYDEVPVDGVVDLGGGNHIVAYEVNEAANFRVTTKYGHDGEKVAAMPHGSRIHEGGFRLVTGRAGIKTHVGHLPMGTYITQGIYVIEDGDAQWEFKFYNDLPIVSNPWATSTVTSVVESPLFGKGRMSYVIPTPTPAPGGVKHNIAGSMTSDSFEAFEYPTQA